MAKPTDKRARLIETAMDRVHAQGFNQTTLAHVAEQAEVPLGNVYYYFKTKQALGEAVVEQRKDQYQSARDAWDASADPKARLTAFVQMTLDNRKLLVERGCPIGTLCAELHKEPGPLAESASDLFADFLSWLTAQFKALGQGKQARSSAIHLLSALQGATLLAHSFHNGKYIESEAERLLGWIEAL